MKPASGAFSGSCRCSIRRATIAPTTIATTRAMGVDIKMVTGDHEAIARQIAGQLELGQNIVVADTVFGKDDADATGCRASLPPTDLRGSSPSTNSRSSRRCRAPATSSA